MDREVVHFRIPGIPSLTLASRIARRGISGGCLMNHEWRAVFAAYSHFSAAIQRECKRVLFEARYRDVVAGGTPIFEVSVEAGIRLGHCTSSQSATQAGSL